MIIICISTKPGAWHAKIGAQARYTGILSFPRPKPDFSGPKPGPKPDIGPKLVKLPDVATEIIPHAW